MTGPSSQGSATGVADEWADVARALGSAPAPAPVRPEAPPAPASPAPAAPVRSAWDPTPGWHEPAGPAAAPQPPVAHVATAADHPPAHTPADLRQAMADGGARRDLRRILIAFGAIGKPREPGQTGSAARPEDVVGAFMTASGPVIDALLRNAGAISDEARLVRFVEGIAAVGRRSDPTDPRSVTAWITAVGAILRDDASA